VNEAGCDELLCSAQSKVDMSKSYRDSVGGVSIASEVE
jgi:hypothetical protein